MQGDFLQQRGGPPELEIHVLGRRDAVQQYMYRAEGEYRGIRLGPPGSKLGQPWNQIRYVWVRCTNDAR